jgi:hypothetical protein
MHKNRGETKGISKAAFLLYASLYAYAFPFPSPLSRYAFNLSPLEPFPKLLQFSLANTHGLFASPFHCEIKRETARIMKAIQT